MLKEKLTFERRKAILLTVEFKGTVEEYAMAWLKLTNNTREYSNMIWKIQNTSSNTVYVYCNPKSAEAVKNFCTGIVSFYHEEEDEMHYVGEVTDEQEVIVGVPIYEWDSTCNVTTEYEQWEEDFDKSIHEWLAVEDD